MLSKKRREKWVTRLATPNGEFGRHSSSLMDELKGEITKDGVSALVDHLRQCGAIPESYGHDSSEEKLYSKYTDSILSLAFQTMGMSSLVLSERADAADVECVAKGFSFVADAKAFRLSRTAKNQKDFKVQAMHGWKRGKPFAMVVAPLYQLPSSSSQIYEQAATRSVCIFSYSHLAMMVEFAQGTGKTKAVPLLHEVFKTVEALHPGKSAANYWLPLNRLILEFHPSLRGLWEKEKLAAAESVVAAREEALTYLMRERERLMGLSKDAAIAELIRLQKLDSREKVIRSVSDNGLLNLH